MTLTNKMLRKFLENLPKSHMVTVGIAFFETLPLVAGCWPFSAYSQMQEIEPPCLFDYNDSHNAVPTQNRRLFGNSSDDFRECHLFRRLQKQKVSGRFRGLTNPKITKKMKSLLLLLIFTEVLVEVRCFVRKILIVFFCCSILQHIVHVL